MTHRSILSCLFLVAVTAVGMFGLAEDSPTEAPAVFDTPTLAQNPSSQSKSNGITEPAGDSYALDQQIYETTHDAATGLGPVYNARACAECHQNPVSRGASQFTELRVGHLDANGNFVNPTVPSNDGANTISGRSIINDRAFIPQAQEHIPATENIRALRAALNTRGDGFVEAIDDATLEAIADNQPRVSDGRIHGEAILVPILEAPGQTRVGRFGWKDQHSSLLSFIDDAYLNMGVTNRLRPKDTTTVGKITADRRTFRTTSALPTSIILRSSSAARRCHPAMWRSPPLTMRKLGNSIFARIGCGTCHVATIVTAPAGTVINGGAFTVPDALRNKTFHPYGDYPLHDVGTGDGIVQGGPADTRNKLRTTPLGDCGWGLDSCTNRGRLAWKARLNGIEAKQGKWKSTSRSLARRKAAAFCVPQLALNSAPSPHQPVAGNHSCTLTDRSRFKGRAAYGRPLLASSW